MEKVVTMREILESKAYQQEKERVQQENHNPLIIDRGVFKKDKEELERTLTLKYQWRETIKKLGFTKRTFPRKGLQTLLT